MELLLLSSSRTPAGYLTDYLAEIKAFSAGVGKAAFVPFAAVALPPDEYLKRVSDAIGHLRFAIEIARTAEDLEKADLIIVGGGNTFQLLRECRTRDLLAAIQEKVNAGTRYLGWSAGTNLACPTIKTTNDMPIVDPGGLDALGLIGFQINPHYLNVSLPGDRLAGGRLAARVRIFDRVARSACGDVVRRRKSPYTHQANCLLRSGNVARRRVIQCRVTDVKTLMTQTLPHAAPKHAPDAELARRVAAGDSAAFEALMRRHNRTLFRAARAILRDDAEAEDALQEAYLQAYQAIGSFRGDAKLSTWFARIVANEALMRLRKHARRAAIVPLQSSAVLEPDQIPDTDMDKTPERSAQRTEMRRLLEAQIDSLPDDYRAVFVLRAVEEMSVEETAAVLRIPQATVRSRLFRARSLLREALAAKIDLACEEAFAFAGERCDRIVANVMKRIG